MPSTWGTRASSWKGTCPAFAKGSRQGLIFQKEGQAELLGLIDRLIANPRAAASLFVTKDMRAARLLAAEKQAFRDMEAQAMTAHLERLRTRRPETAETASLPP